MLKDKPTPMLAIKNVAFHNILMWQPVVFFTNSIFFLYSIHSLQV